MEQEKLIIEGLEIIAEYINDAKFKLIHVINGNIYQYTSLSDSCSFAISRCEVDSYYTLSVTKAKTFNAENKYYLINKSEADKIIRYFGLTGKQEPILRTGFMQFVDSKDRTKSTTKSIKYKIIPLTADDVEYVNNDKPVEGFQIFIKKNLIENKGKIKK